MRGKFLNAKEKKEFLAECEGQFGCSPSRDLVYFQTNQEDVFIITRDIERVDTGKLRVNSMGLYIAEWHNGVRLGIEGSELLGSCATKSVVELNDQEVIAWVKGEDVYRDDVKRGIMIIKHGEDFLGCARATEGRLINHFPKARRIMK